MLTIMCGKKCFTKVVEHGYGVENKKSSFVMQFLEDTIKIQSIADGQLSSPIFGNMIGYTWCASKLWNERDIFINVNKVCFPADILKTPASCTKSSYISCSRCRNIFCFSCLYDNQHSGLCLYDYITALIVHIVLVVFFFAGNFH